MMLRPTWVAVMCLSATACLTAAPDDTGFVDPYAGSFTLYREIDAYGDLRLFASDNPGLTGARTRFTTNLSDPADIFWTLDVVETGPETRDISLSIDFTTFGGCHFTGSSTTFQGELTEGSCVLPTDTGHVVFQLGDSAARYETYNIFGTSTTILEGRWMEEQDGFLLTGDGSLYLRQHDQNSSIADSNGLPVPSVASFDSAFSHGGTCVNAGIFGTGMLMDGDATFCSGGALEWGGSGFDLYVDDGARLSFVPLDQNEPDQRIQGVPAADGQGLTAFTGNLAGLHTRYELDFTGEQVSFTNHFLYTPDGGISAPCTVRWEGPLTACE